jgi:thioredoxin 1
VAGTASNRALFTATAVAVATVCVLACGCGGGDEQSVGADSGTEASAESVQVAAVGGSGIPVLLDLGADKCVPCKAMAPILDEMRGTFAGQLDVRFIDVWKDAAAAREHEVKVIPTQIFFDEEGNELFRHQGFFSREDMLAKWAEFGYHFEG